MKYTTLAFTLLIFIISACSTPINIQEQDSALEGAEKAARCQEIREKIDRLEKNNNSMLLDANIEYYEELCGGIN